MARPPVEGKPLVLYCGPDSTAVVDRWNRSDRPFDLRGLARDGDVGATLERDAFDCVVCHGTGPGGVDVSRVVRLVRERNERVPVVVFDAGRTLDVGAAVDIGVTQYFDVGDDFDPVDDLARLEPLVERTREQRRTQSMLDSLLDHIPLSVYFKDRTGRHIRVSDALTTMIGPPYLDGPDGKRHHTPEDVVGKTDYDLYPADLAEETVEDDQQIVDSGESIDERIERSAGGELDGTYVATSKAPWYDDQGQIQGVVGVTRNITDRQRYEKQLERQNERLERFASVISHDLRNPLEVAFGRLEFAEKTGDEEHFAALENALDRMNALIDDVLTLARQGETVSDPEMVELTDAAAEAWSVVDAPAATLTVDSEATVLADPGRLKQLLENLFRNAVEHAGDDVRVVIGDTANPPGFYVADDGPGVPDTDRDSVFEPGFTTGDDGTGLGLGIVRTIGEAHGWDVSVTDSVTAADGSDREAGDEVDTACDFPGVEPSDGESRGARFEFTEVQRVTQ